MKVADLVLEVTAQQAEEQVEEEGEGKEGTTSVHCSDLWISNEVHVHYGGICTRYITQLYLFLQSVQEKFMFEKLKLFTWC